MEKLGTLILLLCILFSGCAGSSYGNNSTGSITPIESVETNCFHDGKKYSSGSILSIDGKKMKCGIGFWMDTTAKKQALNNSSVLVGYGAPSTASSTGVLNSARKTDELPALLPISEGSSTTCHYSGKKYSSGATLTIEGIKNTCLLGSWLKK